MSRKNRWVPNLTLAAWCIADIIRWAPHLTLEDGVLPFAFLLSLLISFAAMAFFSLSRPGPTRVDNSAATWLLVILSATLPQCFELLPAQPPNTLSDWVLLASGLLLLASVASLRNRFALLPADRGVVAQGPYRLVRHPIYTSYLLADLTAWLPAFDPLGAAVWIAEAVLFHYRARAEERLLSQDPAYSRYAEAVPHRFLPGIL
ncbi:MAG: isoprenylcysteine carboxylmethyltransferase family protein [Bryobacteraceae bacterium]|nr:isoprenylcysteine carboxylmethyltransferase family protein [Bryobacteraceae bacterium]